ncbi:MAG: SPFH domain-containing protein [Euryarchaeota archaeon]|nr:SPFH domain-containing protein [Euryarchaeota archaeon]
MSLIGADTFIWDDTYKRNNVMWKLPRNIRLNDNIVVREDEIAVFYRDGKALAYFDRPDRYALTSQNAPIIGALIKALSGVQQQAEVFYLQKRAFDAKFGSKQPYQFRDKEFGMVNLRVFGEFRYKVKDPANFITQFVGTLNAQTAADIEDRTKEQVVIVVYDSLGKLKEKGMGVADLAANLTTIEQVVLERAKDHFELYGVSVEKLSGLYINMPEEVQKAVDTKSSMTILGTNYMQYQAGQAMRDAANQPGGAAGGAVGAGVGVGAGFGMGYMMVDAMRQQQAAAPAGAAAQVGGGLKACVKCQNQIAQDAMFCPKCGAQQQAPGKPCPKCGAGVAGDAAFCPKCGTKMGGGACAKCGASLEAGTKFCPKCGQPTGM